MARSLLLSGFFFGFLVVHAPGRSLRLSSRHYLVGRALVAVAPILVSSISFEQLTLGIASCSTSSGEEAHLVLDGLESHRQAFQGLPPPNEVAHEKYRDLCQLSTGTRTSLDSVGRPLLNMFIVDLPTATDLLFPSHYPAADYNLAQKDTLVGRLFAPARQRP